MTTVVCAACGVGGNDVPAVDVWDWFRAHAVLCTPRPKPALPPATRVWKRQPCGTRAGAQTHYRNGEPACPSCRAALAAYVRQRLRMAS